VVTTGLQATAVREEAHLTESMMEHTVKVV
jgi:hypothetical protein